MKGRGRERKREGETTIIEGNQDDLSPCPVMQHPDNTKIILHDTMDK